MSDARTPDAETTPTTDAGGTPPEPPKTIQPSRRSIVLMTLVALVGVLAILYAWQLWPFTGSLVTTENAYVRGQLTVLAPQVAGYVTEVRVQDFEQVRQGQVLVRIDDRQYQQRSPSAAPNGTPHASSWKTSTSNWPPTAPPWPRAAPTCSPPRPKRHGHGPTSVASTNSPSAARCPSASATRPAPAPARVGQRARARAAIEIAEQTLKASGISRAACRPGSRSPRQRCTRPRSTWPTPRSSPWRWAGQRGGRAPGPVRYCRHAAAVPGAAEALGNRQLQGDPDGEHAPRPAGEFRGRCPQRRAPDRPHRAHRPGHGLRVQPAAPGQRHRQFHQGGPAAAGAHRHRPDQPLLERLRPGLSVVTHVDTAAP